MKEQQWNDVQKAVALSVFIKSNGDINQAHEALKEKCRQTGEACPPLQTLKKWERDHTWRIYYLEVKDTLMAEAAKAALGDLRDSFRMVTEVKDLLYGWIFGVKDANGNVVKHPMRPDKLETTVAVFLRVLDREEKMMKALGGGKEAKNPVLEMLGKAASGNK